MEISTDRQDTPSTPGTACARCSFDNPSDEQFCGCCGAPLDVTCAVCGTRNPPRFSFCGGCGAPLETGHVHAPAAVPAAEAERRQLTVMFCDLVGSTRLSLDLDPEELRELVRGYQTTCARAVERFGGHIAQYLGDGVLAYFGYPVAQENEAERAVRAALTVTREIRRLAERWRHRTGEDLAVRVGIHTGLVVVGEVGGGARRENLALGGTPNIAARLQAVAEPDTVVISSVTHRLVSRVFETTDLGVQSLRGVSGIGSIHRVDGVRVGERAKRRTPLVGRESHMAVLTDTWAKARTGEGGTIVIRGDGGIGKSHLVDAFLETLGGTHLVIECRCLPYYQNTPLYPVIDRLETEIGLKAGRSKEEAVRSLAAVLDRDGLPVAEALPVFAALLGLPLPDAPPAERPSPEALKEQTQAWLIRLLLQATESCTVVFLVEDVHWADPSTLDLLDRIIAQAVSVRLLCLFTARPSFSPPRNDGQAGVRVLDLDRLSRADSERVVDAVAGKPIPDEVLRQIVVRGDGVPLFIEELSKTVLQSGLLLELERRYELNGPLPPLAIPATLQDSLEARLDRLAAVKEIAQLGATIGREFGVGVLREVSGLDEIVLTDALQRLCEAEVLEEVESGSDTAFTFTHALIQEAAYESLLRSTRQRYHMRIAEVLSRATGTQEAEPETIAWHYANAGLPARSAPYWLEAGRRSIRAWANLEAVSHFRSGLAQLALAPADAGNARVELELQAALGTALIASEGYTSAEVRRSYERARTICVELGEHERLATVLIGLFAYHIVRLDLDDAGLLANELTRLAGTTGSEEIRLLADAAHGSVFLNRGELEPARKHLESAIATYDPGRHASLHASFGHDIGVVCHAYMGVAHWFAGYPLRSKASGAAAVELARRVDHPHSLALALAFHGAQHLWRRQLDEAGRTAEELLALSTEHRFRHWQADALLLQACLLADHGKADAALERVEHARSLFRDRGSGADPQYDLRVARVMHTVGRPDDAIASLAEINRIADASRAFRWQAEYALLMALSLEATGRPDEAETWLRQSIEDARRQGALSAALRAAIALGRHLAARDRPDEGLRVVKPIYDSFTEGHELPDLIDAAALIEELSARSER